MVMCFQAPLDTCLDSRLLMSGKRTSRTSRPTLGHKQGAREGGRTLQRDAFLPSKHLLSAFYKTFPSTNPPSKNLVCAENPLQVPCRNPSTKHLSEGRGCLEEGRLGVPGQVWEFRFLPSFPSFPRENRSSKNVWENTWKSQTSFLQTSAAFWTYCERAF